MPKLSIIIPAHNESEVIQTTTESLIETLTQHEINHEILVINDHSSDNTEEILKRLSQQYSTVRYLNNPGKGGFGLALRHGLENYTGEYVAIFMADASDSPGDLVNFYRKSIEGEGYDAVFGSRFAKGGKTVDYPFIKLILNRLGNNLIRLLFGIRYDDVTNAFKLYKRSTIDGLKPFLSPHFNLTVELPLKTIVRGYHYTYIPNSWNNRSKGTSKFKIKEIGSRYLFVIFYCLIEKYFSMGDYKKTPNQ